jgi:magnesium-protoporphyrin O-methyltransferase
MFDRATAEADLADYRSGTIKKNSRQLVDALSALPLDGSTLLDIGGGIGVNSFELFKKGLAQSTQVELSDAYADVFESEVVRKGLNAGCIRGDFVQLHEQVPDSHVVCLDKVICCYPHFRDLVRLSCAKASRWYALVIPRDTWWVRLFAWLGNAWRSLAGDGFRAYVHPIDQIESILLRSGFQRTKSAIRWEWLTLIYTRVQAPHP